VASIDFPLHGLRANDKLSEAILGATGPSNSRGAHESGLAVQFARQGVVDLRRALEVVSAHPEVDGSRAGYVGFSLGAMLGALFCAHDPRIRAAVLAIGGGGMGPEAVDPVHHIGLFAPRPLLFVNAEQDTRVPRARAEALHEAAGEPKRILWFDSGHADLPGAALKAIWHFLRQHLEIADP
jgi:dienelactone hydrolase